MMIGNNLLLYGSLARGEACDDSDIDLLSLIEGDSNKIIKGSLSLSYYNLDKMRNMAQQGSLFVYHLVSESVVLHDESGVLRDNIFNAFHIKSNYREDLCFSRQLLSIIVDKYGNLKNYKYANMRAGWCIRTFIAALGANNNDPMFSNKKIYKEFGSFVVEFIKIKGFSDNKRDVVQDIAKFMDKNVTGWESYMYCEDLENFKSKVIKKLDLNACYLADYA